MLTQRPKILTTFLCTLLTTSALADAPCNFDSKSKVIYEGKLEAVRLIKKDISPHVEDTRKCTMSIEARVKGKWYPSKGSYIFGPDMSQMDACGLAENRAKVKVMREVIPETLIGEKNLKCNLTKPKNSCKIVYMNTSIGKVKVMETCEK